MSNNSLLSMTGDASSQLSVKLIDNPVIRNRSESVVEKLINTSAAKIYAVKNEVNFKYTQFYHNQGNANDFVRYNISPAANAAKPNFKAGRSIKRIP